ncbi:hypothetical protein [Dysgonomonas sp. 520]|uniref:hypothetical protein n=1 Tax=Dysgonomonas sp. 520 TaxID=2302931 RepID=UPI0013D73034|nr:hypothetical protein [Dysgonomonas sp. 520]NDW08721.1 hypothetical protein [Dysgonomonas sp. 520]
MRSIGKSICICILILFCANVYAQKDKYLIEAEAFQFKGKWIEANDPDCFARKMLRVLGGGKNDESTDALTVVDIQEEGTYTVWVRAADYKKDQGSRLFQLFVNDQPMLESGKHGKEGFYWENVGKVELEKKQILLRIHDTKRNYGRCDAILLVKDSSIDPNETPRIDVGKWRKNPAKVKTSSLTLGNISSRLFLDNNVVEIAKIENDNIRLSFVGGGVNNKVIACRTEIKMNGKWQQFLTSAEDHKVFLITSDSATVVNNEKYLPLWPNSDAKSSFSFNGKSYVIQQQEDLLNPYNAGDMSEAIPVNAVQINNTTIKVQYITKNNSTITGYWKLPTNENHIEVTLVCHPSQTGAYSMGLAAFQLIPQNNLNNILLPPLYQYKRLTDQPVMVPSSAMQQPVSIAEAKTPQGLVSSFICGDVSSIEQWGSVDFSPMGFAIKNEINEVQPVMFSPILGMEDSKVKAGETIKRKFIIGALPKGWTETMEYVSDNVFKVNDYRKQENLSLTESMFNIFDLMKNKEYGGWDVGLKGFYDIEGDPETAPTVVHAAPLAIIAAAVFSDDEEFYLSHGLPTIEYTLSRSGYRWAIDIVPTGYNRTMESLRLNPFTSQFSTSYYEGLYHMLGGKNAWLKDIALPGDTLRKTSGYSVPVYSWVQALSAYKLTKNHKWLNLATSTADRYISTQIYANTSKPLNRLSFYNTTFYSPWWNLIDLYEETKNGDYLKAAQYGAAHTIAGIRSYPAVKDEEQVIHPGNKYDGNTSLWWKGKEKYRLGFPRVANDVTEKKVPEWLVSPVGLGFEQSTTYYLLQKGKQVRPVFMSNWAPHLLRLYQYTNKPIYQTYARNAVIGRFTNYPGYYATGYTDVTMSPDFPYKGPDFSSIYYHHIPPHFAFTWDYLVSEVIERSGRNVSFPYGKQEGFVWFSNRIYGAEKGNIFGDKEARLWMKKGLVTLNNPALNYITAISDKNFWVIVTNESDKEETFDITLNKSLNIAVDAPVSVYSEKGSIGKQPKTKNKFSTTISGKGFRAISFPLVENMKRAESPVLKEGLKVVDMGDPFGKVFVFRIRSPFGWDSVYGYSETPPLKGKNASLEIVYKGETTTVSHYPFEWSFYKLKMDEDAEFEITAKVDGKETVKKVYIKAK